MSVAVYLGVDGGGTKTRFALTDADGLLLGEAERGTSYHPHVGLDGVSKVLVDGLSEVLAAAGCTSADIIYAFFGLPAFGEDSEATTFLRNCPAAVLGHDRYACDNDMVCGWAGSLACADGINIVAGTGSIGYGQRSGMTARAGGWGEAFSDEGSAYWIAMRGLNAYSRMSDGRLSKGPLHAILNAHFQLENDLGICAHVYGGKAYARGELAQLSHQVAEAAQVGDNVALGIYRDAGSELAHICDTLRRGLGFEMQETVPVSYSGGAFNAGEFLLAPFREALATASRHFDLRLPLHAPHYGAALYAAMLGRRDARSAYA
ncbi:MAG: BadF/BadG/BcrA/BcrD ATPase family protein [Rhodanobacter sp.]